MLWSDFVDQLKAAKKAKKSKGLSVPTIATLLYSGAMDSMMPPGFVGSPETYKPLYDQVCKALGSVAKLAKKKKTEMLGLQEVDGAVSLSLWRHQVNPLSTFDIVGSCKEDLKPYGFVETKSPSCPMERKVSDIYKTPGLLTPHWSKVFQNKVALDVFEAGKCELVILGVIISAEVKPYSDGTKERLCFKMYTGVEYTDEITVWPDKSGKLPVQIKEAIKSMEMGFAVVRPKTWNGRPGATLLCWQKLVRQ